MTLYARSLRGYEEALEELTYRKEEVEQRREEAEAMIAELDPKK